MNQKIITILIAAGAIITCGGPKLSGGAQSKEALVSGFVTALSQGNADTIRSFLVRKAEYVEAIHPHTPEAKNVSGEDWWNNAIIRRRDLLTTGLINKFAKQTCRTEITGKEKWMEKHGPVTFYREIPVKIICGENTQNRFEEDSNSVFGIVVEKNGVFKILNIFKS